MSGNQNGLTEEIARAVDQICSPLYVQMFEQVAREQPIYLLNEQKTLLSYYPNEITWYDGNQRKDIIERIRRTHLKWFNQWLGEYYTGRPPYPAWTSVMENLLLHACNIFFRMDLGDSISSEETRQIFQQIIDTIKRILLATLESNPIMIDPAAIPFVQELLLILFYFTLDHELVIYLKSLHLVDLMNILLERSNNDDEIHLQAYRILAVIMAEADIKQLENSSRIAAVFITFIRNVIDAGISFEARLHNSLRSLKVLTQHDQIREELIKQGGHLLFLRCAQEEHFDPLKAKLPALEILLALAFSNDFSKILKTNLSFMDHIRTLTSSSQQDLQRVATALIWKLEKESETNDKKIPKQYDIMISYSHSDKELCHRILHFLEQDQLRVWIDSRLMHGATFDAMAKAIENAEFVLVCMSDAYKQSPFCEMEASYAVKRRCHIIPLVMTPNYKADGWLGVLTSALIYIDFCKLGFEKACMELKKQIELFRRSHAQSTEPVQDQIQHTTQPTPVINNKKEPRPLIEYPHCIDTWSQEQVKSFLLDKDLEPLLSVFEGMNGQLVHQAYLMCQSNPHAMYLSLKDDVTKSHHGTLSLKDFLTFLKDIKTYIPYSSNQSSNPTSAICNLM